jgi:hypothetical protein
MGIFDDSSYFNPLQSPFATAQYRPTPSGTLANAPAPGPLSIPPAQPPIFLSPPDPAAAPSPPASPWDSLANGINNHALTLIALGAGIAQGGVGRGLAAAATAAEGERNRQAQQLNLLQTYKALTDGGVPAQEAQAAIGNPSLMRALAAKYLGPRSPGNALSPAVAPASAAIANPAAPPTLVGNNPRPNAPSDALNAFASARAPAPPVSIPLTPPNVSRTAFYSPSRNMWKDGDGNLFDHQGKAVT